MPISALPDDTVQLLGSPLVISSPESLVKELLDNAIDAEATAVEILISPNTIDKIEVRDNGVGIHPDDFDALGRRGHTSKLTKFEELNTLGGRSLGFRGEALASANALAKITITTKTKADPVATALQIVPKRGGILERQPRSAPVGTTVSITGLFGEIPVRRQHAVKESVKTLDRIKELLRSYALARPQLRLSLRVLKAAKLNWSYSPKTGDGAREAALQLFGSEVAAQCFEKTTGLGAQTFASVAAHDEAPVTHYVFHAFMLKPDATSTRLPKHRYFSVDGRPLSPTRGTMKKLVSIYCSHVSRVLDKISPSDVFLRLNISCPSGSYDPNVEPSKDDVIFEDEAALLSSFEDFCEQVYGPPRNERVTQRGIGDQPGIPRVPAPGHSVASATMGIEQNSDPTGGHLMPASVVPVTSFHHSRQMRNIGTPENINPPRSSREIETTPAWKRASLNAAPTFTTASALLKQGHSSGHLGETDADTSGPIRTAREGKGDMSANMNVSLRRTTRAEPSFTPVPGAEGHRGQSPYQPPWSIFRMLAPPGSARVEDRMPSEDHAIFQEPQLGRPSSPELEILRHPAAPPRDLEIPLMQPYPSVFSNDHLVSDVVTRGQFLSPKSSPMHAGAKVLPAPRRVLPCRTYAQPPWTPPSSNRTEQHERGRIRGDRRIEAVDDLQQTTISFSGVKAAGKRKRPSELPIEILNDPVEDGVASRDPHSDRQSLGLNQGFGISCESEDAAPSRRPLPRCRPDEGRQTFTKIHSTNFQPEPPVLRTKEPVKTVLPSGDPRAYLLRRQKSMAADESAGEAKKFKRLKSNLLPLENTPTNEQVHNLVLVTIVDCGQLSESVKRLQRYDKYVEEGDVEEGLDMSLGEGCRIEAKLNELLSSLMGVPMTDGGSDVRCNLSALLKGKSNNVEA